MSRYFFWLPLFGCFFVYQMALEAYLGSQMKVAVTAFIREIVVRVLNIALLLLFAFNLINFDWFVTALVFIYFVPVVTHTFLAMKTKPFGISFNFKIFSRAEYKDLIHFTWYHFLLTFSMIIFSTMDSVMLPFSDPKGLSDLAVYATAVFGISFLQMPSKAMASSTFAVLAKAFADNDNVKVKDIFSRSSLNILIATIAIGILISCNLQNAVSVMKSGYEQVIPVFLILAIGKTIDISTGMNDQVLSITNHYKFNLYVSVIISAILFMLIKILVPRYGICGAAWSTTITLVLFNIAKYTFIWKKLDMQPYSSKSLLVVLAGLPALAVGYYFPHLFETGRHVYVYTFIDSFIRSGLIIIIYFIMLLWLKPSPDLEEYLALIKKEKRLF